MEKKFTISEEKKDALYRVVDSKIMDARIKIMRLLEEHSGAGKKVDEILYHLGIEASQSAINIFKKK